MIQYKKLECGVGLVTERVPIFQSACIGIWVGAGSICENDDNSGISHFIEHMIFKGTDKRNAFEIAKEADNLGASFNAFTGKEATCFHIKSLTEVFPKATDLLLDIFVNSVFDPKEMGRERGVILEEKKMVEDTPDDIIIDLITDRTLFGTPLQSTIIGTNKSLNSIKRDDIIKYRKSFYTKDNIVVAAVGTFDKRTLENQINKAFAKLPEKSKKLEHSWETSAPRYVSKTKDIAQTHIALGLPGLTLDSDDYYAQAIVNDILGGTMSSRLFQNIREQRGLAYSVFSAPLSYSKSGLFCIYAGITQGKEQETIDAIAFELDKIGKEGLTKEEVAIVKQRLKSALIFGNESLSTRMNALGKNRLLLGRNYSEQQIMDDINSVTMDQIMDYCNRISDITKYSGAVISNKRIDLKKMIG